MIKHLGQKHSVVVASLAHTKQELAEGAGLSDYCEDVITDVLPYSTRWLRAFKALPTSIPSSVAYFWSPRLHKRIQESAARTRFDAVFAHCAFVAQYVMDVHTDARIMDFCDIDSGKWAEYSKWKPFPSSRLFAFEAQKLRAYERRIAQRMDHCLVATQGEKDEFQRLRVSTPCTVVPNGVDINYFSPSACSESRSAAIVFVGRMDYFPNVDAVCYFAREILPIVRKTIPNVEFRIVGSNPVRRVRKLAQTAGIIVTAQVPDVRTYIRDAAVTVAPLRIARGTQNKILESMAMGIPVVATPEAAKGIQAIPGKHLLVGPEPNQFAKHIVDLLGNENLRLNLARLALQRVQNMHVWTAATRIVDDVLAAGTALDAQQVTTF